MSSSIGKKGISELVSYVLLVVIALGISVIVYNYLSNYVPKEKPMCEEDISILVSNIKCNSTSGMITYSYSNNGFFAIDFLYVRLSPEGRQVARNIDEFSLDPALNPGQSSTRTSDASSAISQPGAYNFEVEPAVMVDRQLALCDNSINTQQVQCSP